MDRSNIRGIRMPNQSQASEANLTAPRQVTCLKVIVSHFTVAWLVLLTTLCCQQSAFAQANVQGQWQTLPTSMPINPVHVALMHTGQVLVVSGSGNVPGNTNYQAGVWDPASDTVTTQPVGWDMFCNGMVVLPDGRPFVMGGTLAYDPFHGSPKTSAYDPLSGQFVDLANMAHGRRYPTATTLGDGSVMVYSGLNENGPTNNAVEIYTPGSGWSQEYPSWIPPLYPRMHLLPSGSVFYSGPENTSKLFDTGTKAWSDMPTTNYSGGRLYGSSVLLPLTPANGYKPLVMIFGGGNPATATTEIIDLSAASPSWQYGPPMSQPRIEMNAVILPSGQVLALGGSTNDEDATTASLNADLFAPDGTTVSSGGQNAYPRLYHSVALLLPDATVWVAGGNPTRGNYEPHMEIYSPPYLFAADGSLAPRPSITSVTPGVIAYGNTFQVQTPDAANISSVVLMRPGAPTHAFDMDQRLVGMSFTAGNGVLNVTAPPNGNIAPPGYYLLFLLNAAGVPSVGTFVQVSSLTQPDFTLSASPASRSVSVGASTSYTVTVTPGAGFTGTVTLDVSGIPPSSTATFTPPTITASGSSTLAVSTSNSTAPGNYQLIVTGTSGTVMHSTALSLTINPPTTNPQPSLSSISPNTVAAGSAGFTLTLTGANFVSNSVVKVNGADRTTTFVSATQLTAAIPTFDVAVGANLPVTVFNAAPGGGTSGPVTLTVNNPQPSLSSISPSSVTAGSAGFTLTLTGANFIPNSVVNLNGAGRTTTFVSATQLTAAIPASDVAAGANLAVTVFNAGPGGGTSGPVTLTVNNPLPSLSSMSPTSVLAGSGGVTLTLTGGNFVPNSIVQVNGASRATTFVSATQLTAAIPASDVAIGAYLSITVFNAAPGGGTSTALTLTVNNPLPSISSISPNPAIGISGFTLTVSGSGFIAGSVVQLDGRPVPTTFVSTTQLKAQISAMGQHAITVFNSSPGGGTSNSVTLTVVTLLGQTSSPNAEWLPLDARFESFLSGLP